MLHGTKDLTRDNYTFISESKYGVLGTIMMQWLLGGAVVGSHETCHVTCGHGL